MAGLFDSLTMAARSLQSQQYGMNVTGQNISNVNTPGYTRRVVDFEAVPPGEGGGVDVQGVRAIRDTLLDRRLLQQVPLGARDAAVADTLGVVEASLSGIGAGVDAQLDRFFSAFATLAENPTSAVARQEVEVSSGTLASAFNDTAARLESGRRDADGRIRSAVDEINAITARIAAINGALPTAKANGSELTLEDEQAQLVRRLSELAGVHVIPRQDGGMDVTIGNGRPLVVGGTGYQIGVTPAGPYGYASLTSEGVTITGELSGGALGGFLEVRDRTIPAYQEALDTIAAQVVTSVNALHTAGWDLSGAAGGPFFSYSVAPTGVDGTIGAAGAIRLDPAIAVDNRRIAAAAIAASGDNGTARAIAALRSERVLGGGTATLTDGWGELMYQLGSDVQGAEDARDTHAAITREVEAMRDQVSGVSLDEEALHLMKFQRAYEANARFFRAVDDMLITLLNIVR
jgi:flagellar hook-associated protein 1 FlgK